jgi:hypothetical protein
MVTYRNGYFYPTEVQLVQRAVSWMWQSRPRPYHTSTKLSSAKIQPFMNILQSGVLNFGEVLHPAGGNVGPIRVASLPPLHITIALAFCARPRVLLLVKGKRYNWSERMPIRCCRHDTPQKFLGGFLWNFVLCIQENSIFVLIHVRYIFHERQIQFCEVHVTL